MGKYEPSPYAQAVAAFVAEVNQNADELKQINEYNGNCLG